MSLFSGHPYGIQGEREIYSCRLVGYKHDAPTELAPRTEGGGSKVRPNLAATEAGPCQPGHGQSKPVKPVPKNRKK